MCSLYRVNIWHNVSDMDGGGGRGEGWWQGICTTCTPSPSNPKES